MVLSATLIGGIYGALYDQLTYTVSNEFFKNTWAVGLGLGFFLSLVGLLHAEKKRMFYSTIKSFLIALFTAFVFGIIALLFSNPPADVTLANNVIDKTAFNKVTSMNNYSYVGGIIGMFLGMGWQALNIRRKEQK